MKATTKKTRTERVLRRKAIFSFGYLVIFIVLILLLFIPTPYTGKLLLNRPIEQPYSGYRLFIWFMALLYFMHFLYGAIYYPRKYKKLVKPELNLNLGGEVSDNSSFRGYIAASLGIMFFSFSFYGFVPHALLIILIILWLICHIILAKITSTDNLFELTSINVDGAKKLPWEYPPTVYKPGEKTVNIHFYLPVLENEEVYTKKYIDDYLKAREKKWKDKLKPKNQ